MSSFSAEEGRRREDREMNGSADENSRQRGLEGVERQWARGRRGRRDGKKRQSPPTEISFPAA